MKALKAHGFITHETHAHASIGKDDATITDTTCTMQQEVFTQIPAHVLAKNRYRRLRVRHSRGAQKGEHRE